MLTSLGSIKHNSAPREACWFLCYGAIAHELQNVITLKCSSKTSNTFITIKPEEVGMAMLGTQSNIVCTDLV